MMILSKMCTIRIYRITYDTACYRAEIITLVVLYTMIEIKDALNLIELALEYATKLSEIDDGWATITIKFRSRMGDGLEDCKMRIQPQWKGGESVKCYKHGILMYHRHHSGAIAESLIDLHGCIIFSISGRQANETQFWLNEW